MKIADDVDFQEIGTMTAGYTGSDLYDIIQGVHLKVVREYFNSGKSVESRANLRAITQNDFLEIMKVRKPSISMEKLKLYQEWFTRYKAL